MKYLVLFLIFTLTAPPVQASDCDMESGKQTGHDMSQMVKHSPQQSRQLENSDDGAAMTECCNSCKHESSLGCDQQMHCGSCVASLSLLQNFDTAAFVAISRHVWAFSAGAIVPSHSYPLIRPPIS